MEWLFLLLVPFALAGLSGGGGDDEAVAPTGEDDIKEGGDSDDTIAGGSGEDLLFGVGQDVSEAGRPLGTQLSLFDVSDLRRPTRLYKTSLGLGWSEAESDHHAFLFWPRTGLVVLPFEQRAVGFRVSRARGIDAAGKIEHERGKLGYSPGVRRSLVVRDSVLTVSDSGVKSSSLATLAERGWAAFPLPLPLPLPQPAPQP